MIVKPPGKDRLPPISPREGGGAVNSASDGAAPLAAETGLRDHTSKQRFLEAADRQFIVHGYDRCTIRAIAAQAGTSLASLSRNWASKRHLFAEVFARHFNPIHAAQNAAFDRIEYAGELTVPAIVRAFFGAALSREDDPSRTSHRVYCMALLDPSQEARSITRPLVAPVRLRLIGLLRRALPDLDEARFFLAVSLVLGTYIYPQAYGERLATVMDFDIASLDWEQAAEALTIMISSGLATTR